MNLKIARISPEIKSLIIDMRHSTSSKSSKKQSFHVSLYHNLDIYLCTLRRWIFFWSSIKITFRCRFLVMQKTKQSQLHTKLMVSLFNYSFFTWGSHTIRCRFRNRKINYTLHSINVESVKSIVEWIRSGTFHM